MELVMEQRWVRQGYEISGIDNMQCPMEFKKRLFFIKTNASLTEIATRFAGALTFFWMTPPIHNGEGPRHGLVFIPK